MIQTRFLLCIAFLMLAGCEEKVALDKYNELKEKHAMIKEEKEELSERIDELEDQNAKLMKLADDSEKLKSLFSTDT